MVQIDVPSAFAVGMFSVDLGRKVLKSEADRSGKEKPAAYYRYLFRSVFFAGFVIAPAGIYLLSGWPGWEQIYWSRRFEEVVHTGWVNALLPAAFVMAIVLGAYLGHVLGYRWLVSGREQYLRPTYIGLLVLVSIVVLFNYPSFTLVGTYDQYHGLNGHSRGEMEHAWNNPYGFSAGWVGVMVFFIVPLVYLILRIRGEVRAVAGREGATGG